MVESLRYVPSVVSMNANNCGGDSQAAKVQGYFGESLAEAQALANSGSYVFYGPFYVSTGAEVCPNGFRIPNQNELGSLSTNNFETPIGYSECSGYFDDGLYSYYWHTIGTTSLLCVEPNGTTFIGAGYDSYEMMIKCVLD